MYALNNALAKLPQVSLRVLTTDAAGPQVSDRIVQPAVDELYPNQNVLLAKRIAGACVSAQLLCALPRLVKWADVIHLTGAYSFPTLPTFAVCRFLNRPIVWSARGAVLDAMQWQGTRRRRLKRLWEYGCLAIMKRSRVIVHATSEAERRAMEERIPKTSAVLIPNGVEVPDVPSDKEWRPSGRLRLMYLGRIAPKKGLENLLDAMKYLSDLDCALTIYGTGEREYMETVKAHVAGVAALNRRVKWAGQVDGAAKEAAFFNSDLCIVPSYTENFCIVVAEALAHGLPVIASQGTPWPMLENKRCGLWVTNEPGSIASAIRRIQSNDLERMGKMGRAWMREEFTWDRIAEDMVGLYNMALATE